MSPKLVNVEFKKKMKHWFQPTNKSKKQTNTQKDRQAIKQAKNKGLKFLIISGHYSSLVT